MSKNNGKLNTTAKKELCKLVDEKYRGKLEEFQSYSFYNSRSKYNIILKDNKTFTKLESKRAETKKKVLAIEKELEATERLMDKIITDYKIGERDKLVQDISDIKKKILLADSIDAVELLI